MEALLRYPKSQRRAVAQEWARRSHAAQQAARMECGPDWEAARMHALHDARGQILRHGVTYSAAHPDGQPWAIVRSKRGRVDQVDLHIGSTLVATCGLRALSRGMRRAKLSLNTPVTRSPNTLLSRGD
jgi:hypothetical protein